MYAMLASFTARYDEDQKRTRESFDQIINLQHDANVKNEYNLVRNDLETTYVGLQLLKSYGDCTTKFVSGTSEACMKVNKFGVVDEDGQAATAENIRKIRDAIIANDEGVDGSIGFGAKTHPASHNTLAVEVPMIPTHKPWRVGCFRHCSARLRLQEVHNQGLRLVRTSRTSRARSSTRWETPRRPSRNSEEGYFSVRSRAAQMKGKHEDAKALTSLALSGRGSGLTSAEHLPTAQVFPVPRVDARHEAC